MEVFSFRTIEQASEGIYKEKGSKFIGLAHPVRSEEEVKEKLQAIKKEYFDARHHCYAYILGPDKSKFRAFDDGEPNHSAGDPILGQIRSKGLTNVLIVVVRYFGGVKLGVGGLITAYKASAEDALNHALIVEEEVVEKYLIQYGYASTPEIMKLVKEFELQIIDQQFEEGCLLRIHVNAKVKPKFLEKISLMQALGSDVNIREEMI